MSEHKEEIAGFTDMKALGEQLGDMHYGALTQIIYHLSKKIDADSIKDYEGGREKLASALQYASMGLFEAALRLEKVWKICEPFMKDSQ